MNKKKILEPYSGTLELEFMELDASFFFFKFDRPIPIVAFKEPIVTLKLDFEKIEFQNMGISLISLGNWIKCWIFCA